MLSGNFDLLNIDQALYKAQPHDHLCLIYETLEEWRNVIAPFFEIGLKRKEKCLYIGHKENISVVEWGLQGVDINVFNYQETGQFEFIDRQTWLAGKDGNNPDTIIDMLKQETDQALRDGYTALRVTDDMHWAIKGITHDELIDFEAQLNRDFFVTSPCLLLCQYNQNVFGARLLRDILTAHPAFVRRSHLYMNSYYIPPEILLSDRRDAYQLEEWFNIIERERFYGDRVGFLADVLQLSTQPFCTCSSTGDIITCNKAFCQLSGYELDELRKINWWEDLHVTNQEEQIAVNVLDVYAGGRSQHIEQYMVCKDGREVPVEEFLHQASDNEGNVKYYCIFINDISRRRQNEKALKESEKLYRALFRSMHEGFALCEIICDQDETPVDFKILEVNPVLEQLINVEKDVLIGMTAMNLDHHLHEYWTDIFGKVALSGEAVSLQYYYSELDRYYEVIVFSPAKYKFAVLTIDISQLKNLEKELQEQLHFLQNFIDSIPTPAFYRDTDGIFQFCNKPFEAALGLSRDEIVGKSLYAVLPKDLADKYREMDLTLLSNSGIQCYDWEFQYADGTRRDVIFNKAPLSNSRGEFIGVVGTTVDITQRKKAQEALEISEEKFRNIFSQSPIGIALYDSNGNLIDMNKACQNIFGASDINVFKSMPLFDNEYFPSEAQKKLIRDELVRFEWQFSYERVKELGLWETDKNGTAFVTCYINPISSNDFSTKGFLVQVQDVSEQKNVEEALKKNEADLRRITENMVDMISQVNIDGNIEFVSPSYTSILGYESGEIINDRFLDYVHPEDYARVKTHFENAIETGQFGKIDYRCRTKDGSYCHLEKVGKVIFDEEKMSGVVFGTRDITERKQMEKEIARLDRLRAVGEMAASLGHEIRNPMTTVRGFLQVLGDSPGCEPYQEYFELMIEELDGANAIVTEFLSLAKDKAVYFNRQDLNQVIKAIFPLIAADALKSDKQVNLDLEEIPELLIDAKEVRQLIINLARNGLEAMDAGGHLIICTFSDGQSVTLSVKDTGHGIEPEVLDKIGTPFFSTKDTGTGLGLAICYSIAARHHAVIDIQTSNSGSVFSVVFNTVSQELETPRMIS